MKKSGGTRKIYGSKTVVEKTPQASQGAEKKH